MRVQITIACRILTTGHGHGRRSCRRVRISRRHTLHHRVIAGRQVRERVVPAAIGVRAQHRHPIGLQGDQQPGQPSRIRPIRHPVAIHIEFDRARHRGELIIAGIHRIVRLAGDQRQQRGIAAIRRDITIQVRIAALMRRSPGIARRHIEAHHVICSRRHIREAVTPTRNGRIGRDTGQGPQTTIGLVQNDFHAGQPGFATILNAVPIGIHPNIIANRHGRGEPEILPEVFLGRSQGNIAGCNHGCSRAAGLDTNIMSPSPHAHHRTRHRRGCQGASGTEVRSRNLHHIGPRRLIKLVTPRNPAQRRRGRGFVQQIGAPGTGAHLPQLHRHSVDARLAGILHAIVIRIQKNRVPDQNLIGRRHKRKVNREVIIRIRDLARIIGRPLAGGLPPHRQGDQGTAHPVRGRVVGINSVVFVVVRRDTKRALRPHQMPARLKLLGRHVNKIGARQQIIEIIIPVGIGIHRRHRRAHFGTLPVGVQLHRHSTGRNMILGVPGGEYAIAIDIQEHKVAQCHQARHRHEADMLRIVRLPRGQAKERVRHCRPRSARLIAIVIVTPRGRHGAVQRIGRRRRRDLNEIRSRLRAKGVTARHTAQGRRGCAGHHSVRVPQLHRDPVDPALRAAVEHPVVVHIRKHKRTHGHQRNIALIHRAVHLTGGHGKRGTQAVIRPCIAVRIGVRARSLRRIVITRRQPKAHHIIIRAGQHIGEGVSPARSAEIGRERRQGARVIVRLVQDHGDTCQAGFATVLNPVAIGIHPYTIPDHPILRVQIIVPGRGLCRRQGHAQRFCGGVGVARRHRLHHGIRSGRQVREVIISNAICVRGQHRHPVGLQRDQHAGQSVGIRPFHHPVAIHIHQHRTRQRGRLKVTGVQGIIRLPGR